MDHGTGRCGDAEESWAEMTRPHGLHQQQRGAGAPSRRTQCSPKVTRPFKSMCPWEASSPFLKPQTHELHFGSGKSSIWHRMGHKGRPLITVIVISISSDRSFMSKAHSRSIMSATQLACSTTLLTRQER